MAEIPKIPESPVRTTGTKEVQQTKRKGKPTTDSHHKKDNVKPGKSTHKFDYSSEMTIYADEDEEDYFESIDLEEPQGPPMSYIPHFPPLQTPSFYGSFPSPRSFSVEHHESIDFEIKDPLMSYYSPFPPLQPPSFYGSSSSPRSFSVEHREVEPLSAREVQEKEKNLRHISIEIDELSTMVTTEMLPGQLHSLMVKLIKEQERLVNFQQEMATSVNQRATDSQLDQQTSRDLSELYVLLSKIHLVSLKLNQHRMKSVDEAQMKTDTKVSEKQHQDKMKKGLSDLECTLRHLGHRLSLNYTPPHVQKCETKRYMTESVYYCQQMLVDDLQGLAQQTLLDKEPAYQEQYMKNLNVLINTQQQLVQNLTDLQKQKKGSKLEKESSKQDDLPAGEVGKQQNELELITEQTDLMKEPSKQDDLPAGEIGKQQLNELELINEQTDLVKDWHRWMECHRGWQEQPPGHFILNVFCSVLTVHRIHGRMSCDFIRMFFLETFGYHHMAMHYELNEFAFSEERIFLSQERFLDKAEMWKKRQEKEMQDDSNVVRYSLQDDPTDLKQSKQDDQTDESDLEGLKTSTEKTLLSDKDEEKTSIESGGSPEATLVSDVTDKPIDEDRNLDAITQIAPRNESPSHLEEVLNEFNKQTFDISANKKTDILLQLPYMAVGFFNEKGGILALAKYDVHLYVPHGAIPEGPPQLVYIYVNPDEVDAEKVNSEEKQLSPMVQCGPPGLTFEDSVVLSFPHHADSSGWEFTAKMCPAFSESWQALDSSTDGQLVSAKGGRAIFLVNHFTGFALFGTSSGVNGICVRVGAFANIFNMKSYAFRVYMWKDDRVSEERVEELEKKQRSEMLDTYRNMIFFKDRGHMHVEMTETVEGLEVRPQTTQEIREEDVWAFSQNSVSFNVRIRGGNEDEIPYMAVNCYQQQEGDDGQGRKLLLDVGPKSAQMRNNNFTHTCNVQQRRMCDAAHSIRATCHTDGSGDNTLHSKPMTEVTNAISSVIRRRPCQVLYGGLSDQKVNDLCEFLDNQAAGYHGLPLLDYLSGNEYIPPKTPKKEVLTTYFSLCTKHNIPDQDAVQYLKLVFHELNCTRAAEIIEPGGERTDAESIPQFLDNESLTKGDAEICLRDLAKKLGPEWEDLATYLGIINSELTAVRSECAGRVNGQIFCMLVIWMQRFGSFGSDAFNTLSLNLQRVERNDLVELLKGKVASILFFNKQNNRQLLMKVNKGSSS